jgi:hypothetical protein
MPKIELDNFYNAGFGWICKRCEDEIKSSENPLQPPKPGRIMREGEAESKQPIFSNSALAKWFDKEQTILICPRCEILEEVRSNE